MVVHSEIQLASPMAVMKVVKKESLLDMLMALLTAVYLAAQMVALWVDASAVLKVVYLVD